MGIEVRATVVDGEVRLRVPFEDGTEVSADVLPAPRAARPKMVHEMTAEEFDVWYDSVAGSCPDLEEPPDLPTEPLGLIWDEE